MYIKKNQVSNSRVSSVAEPTSSSRRNDAESSLLSNQLRSDSTLNKAGNQSKLTIDRSNIIETISSA